ncbi:MAG: prenyltransferase/squalene oxidase repeat-containing protein [Thermoguttaceae bacterium]|jgi:geranylgeranyl transferase type-2 subunit beta|nr:prenyltransferase/squalene oxidase repeat-containing protein [Thermoguttaceae bacterium]
MHYLAELTLQLNRAAAVLPEPLRACHATFLRNAQQADGGFPGRAGGSDVYYTSFALRGLLILGELDGDVARRAGSFLAGQAGGARNAVELFTLLSAAMLTESTGGGDWFSASGNEPAGFVQRVLDSLRCSDGGVAKSTDSGVGSTYHTFLAALCRELVGRPAGDADEVVPMLRNRQREDGGFVELPVMRRSGVNPTAAAVALLRMLDALDESLRDDAAGFLGSMQTSEGGFRAHAVIPVADLLSTFTGLVALGDLGRSDRIDAVAARRFVDSLALPEGGYLAATHDDRPDVEYTFYGIAATAMLWS